MTTGQKIAERRKRLGLSQEKLGEQVGVTRQAISKWESDAALPEVEKLAQLSRIFGVTVGWLLGLEEAEENAQPVETPELTRHQLEMIEEIVKRYAAPPEPRKKTPWLIGLTALCLALALCLSMVTVSVIGWRRQIKAQLSEITTDINGIRYSQSSQQEFDYDGLYHQIEVQIDEMVGRKSVLASFALSIVGYDMDASTVTLRMTAVPRLPELIKQESDLQFTALLNGETYSADSLSWDGNTVVGEITVPVKNGCSFFLKLPTENGQQQLCLNNEEDIYYNLRDNAQFELSQWGFTQFEVSRNPDTGLFQVNWGLDEYAYVDIGAYEYYLTCYGDGESTPYDTYGLEMTLEAYINDKLYQTIPVSLSGEDAPHGTLDLPKDAKAGDTLTFQISCTLSDGRSTDYVRMQECCFDGKQWQNDYIP